MYRPGDQGVPTEALDYPLAKTHGDVIIGDKVRQPCHRQGGQDQGENDHVYTLGGSSPQVLDVGPVPISVYTPGVGIPKALPRHEPTKIIELVVHAELVLARVAHLHDPLLAGHQMQTRVHHGIHPVW